MNQELREVQNHKQVPGWVIGEVMLWGMKDGEDWVKKLNLYVEYEEFLIELGDRYFMFDKDEKQHILKEVFPHIKTVVYFDDNKNKGNYESN